MYSSRNACIRHYRILRVSNRYLRYDCINVTYAVNRKGFEKSRNLLLLLLLHLLLLSVELDSILFKIIKREYRYYLPKLVREYKQLKKYNNQQTSGLFWLMITNSGIKIELYLFCLSKDQRA